MDLTNAVIEFMRSLNEGKDENTHIEVKSVKQSELPLYIFEDGIRPERKKWVSRIKNDENENEKETEKNIETNNQKEENKTEEETNRKRKAQSDLENPVKKKARMDTEIKKEENGMITDKANRPHQQEEFETQLLDSSALYSLTRRTRKSNRIRQLSFY